MGNKKITVKELLLLLKNYYMNNNSSELINIGYWEEYWWRIVTGKQIGRAHV